MAFPPNRNPKKAKVARKRQSDDNQPKEVPSKAPRKAAANGASESAKRAAAVAVLNDVTPATLYCFGNNGAGQLGHPPKVTERKYPSLVPDLAERRIIGVAAGGMHTLALDEEGKVWSFGQNDEKALGRATEEEKNEKEDEDMEVEEEEGESIEMEGESEEDGEDEENSLEFSPGLVDFPEEVRAIQITAGDSHSAALSSDGEVWIWGCYRDGKGNFGLVADDGDICRQRPEKITADLGVKITKIASGAHHLVMLAENGRVYTCGTGDRGQLGRIMGRVTRSKAKHLKRVEREFLLKPAPVMIGSRNLKANDIWTGEYSTYIQAENGGDIYVCGLNNYAQLGIAKTSRVSNDIIPVPTKSTSFSMKQWRQIAAGQHHAIALDEDGMVFSLGRSCDGRLGHGKNEGTNNMFDEPTLIEALADVKCRCVASGSSTSHAVTEDGRLFSWGFGENWQLGTGDAEDRHEPTQCNGGPDGEVIRISAGGQHVSLTMRMRSS